MANAIETFKLPTGMGRLIRYSPNAPWTWQRWNRSRNKWTCRPTDETNRGKAEQVVYQLVATQRNRTSRRYTISILFQTVAEQYLEARRTGHKCKRLAPSSLAPIQTVLNTLRKNIGGERYDALQIGQVTESLLTKHLRHVSETTSVIAANKHLRVLVGILNFAVTRKHVPDNVAKKVEPVYPKIMPGEETQDQAITGWACPTTAEVNLILANSAPRLKPTGRTAYNGNPTQRTVYLGINANDYTPLFKALCLTGMRIGEARHLTWDDVDFERHVLLIRPGTKNGNYWKPKTKSSIRRIAMVPDLESILRHLRATNKRKLWVFESRRRFQVSENHPTMAFRRICDGLGFKQHYVIHSLRKYWASTVAAQGMDAMMMIKMFGHTDFELIMKTYYAQNDDARMVAAAMKISFGLSVDASNLADPLIEKLR